MTQYLRSVALHGLVLVTLLGVTLLGCKDLAGTAPLPAGTISPSIIQNATGAVQTAAAAQVIFQTAFAEYVPISGLLTDELQSNGRFDAVSSNGIVDDPPFAYVAVDARLLDQLEDWSAKSGGSNTFAPPATDTLYSTLQQARGLTYQAIGGLAAYAPDSVVLRGKMYALLGYAEIMLADLYCSGVPLSTLTFQGDYTYQPGSTTSQIYQHAIAMFDTALMFAANNPQITNLAKVGQGRAFLGMGDYASADDAVNSVPATFLFSDSIQSCGAGRGGCILSAGGLPTFSDGQVFTNAKFSLAAVASVSDREAGMGLPFVSSGDPRTADSVVGTDETGSLPQYFPAKYDMDGFSVLTLASGVEAQLITAEADLNAGNTAGMFTILNALRKTNPATSGMPTLTDPGTFSADVDTLFTERAAWLFADGHRQGDLRRLMRNYVNGHGVAVVANQYPGGDYGGGVGTYGAFIDAPVPPAELANPHFTGCLSRD